MLKSLLLSLVLILHVVTTIAQPDTKSRSPLQNGKLEIVRIDNLLKSGHYYLDKSARSKTDVDSAISVFNHALRLSRTSHNFELQNKALLGIGECYTATSDLNRGLDSISLVANYYHKKGQWDHEADVWNLLCNEQVVENDSLRIIYGERALALYKKSGNRTNAAIALKNIAAAHYDGGQIFQAERELLQAIDELKILGYKKFHEVYTALAYVYQQEAAPEKELFYRLEAVKSMEASKDTAMAGYYYYLLAYSYNNVHDYNHALLYYTKSMNFNKRAKDFDTFYASVAQITDELFKLKRGEEAAELFEKVSKEFPPVADKQIGQANAIKFNVYYRTGQYQKLEQFIPEYLSFNKKANEGFIRNSAIALNRYFGEILRVIYYYIETKQYEKAEIQLSILCALPQKRIIPLAVQKLNISQFRVDSASGNYVSAIKHLQLAKQLQDSVFNATKSKQIADMHEKYETDKKEQAIKIFQSREQQEKLQRNIQLAKLQKISLERDIQTGELNQAELERKIQQSKLQKITLQRKSDQQKADFISNMQAGEIQKANMQRNITFGGVAMLLVISILAYGGYRNKQRSNLKLQNQQKEINLQNDSLQQLLAEKDWLLKEVHHRVKNNLQIVMSLLSSQSAFLENNAAIEAIRESQNRVQAISLIHQKLYSGNNVASINMSSYVTDLLSYLADSFDTHRSRIRFEQLIEPFNLDLAQAVPLGLIMNESITNAIKYAFDARGGQIIVALQLIKDENLLLTIADNGKGLPANFDLKTVSSLGMEMMKALSKQLGGEFKVSNNAPGVSISIDFQIEKSIASYSKENAIN